MSTIGSSNFFRRWCQNQSASLPIAAHTEEEEEQTTISSRITRRREISDFAEDQIVDILLRLPIECLIPSKRVCKVWYNLINSPNFVSTFNAKNKGKEVTIYCKVRLPYSPRATSTNVSIGFHDIPVEFNVLEPFDLLRIVGSSDGLVCLSFSRKQDKFAIWNPATKQFRPIPLLTAESTRYAFFSSGFCYDPIANAHKISRVEFCLGEDDLHRILRVKLHVFTLNSDSWTEERTLFIPFQTASWSLRVGVVTCVSKHLFWTSGRDPITILRHSLQHDKYILCFDMLQELFTRIELPCPDCYHPRMRIASYKGTIAVFLWRAGPPFDIWVLNDCGGPKQSWSVQQIRTPSPKKFYPITYFSKDGVDFLLVESTSGHLLWNPQSGETIANLGLTLQDRGYATYYQSLTPVS